MWRIKSSEERQSRRRPSEVLVTHAGFGTADVVEKVGRADDVGDVEGRAGAARTAAARRRSADARVSMLSVWEMTALDTQSKQQLLSGATKARETLRPTCPPGDALPNTVCKHACKRTSIGVSFNHLHAHTHTHTHTHSKRESRRLWVHAEEDIIDDTEAACGGVRRKLEAQALLPEQKAFRVLTLKNLKLVSQIASVPAVTGAKSNEMNLLPPAGAQSRTVQACARFALDGMGM